MTLTQLASYITTKLSDTDSASVTVCKDFINRRYQMIWDGALWTETMGVLSVPVTAGTAEVTLSGTPSITFFQSVSVPSTAIDFPVAMKFTLNSDASGDGSELLGYDWQTFFQIDVGAWNSVTARQSTPKNFINLPKNGNGSARLKPVPVPNADGVIFVLGKLKWVALGDSDSPCLRAIDNAVLCYAEGDMLERARQYAKAQAKYAEGAMHVKTMFDIEKGQQQSISMITPMEEGFYDPTGGPQ